MRDAFHAESFDPWEADDFLDDPQTEEDLDEVREEFSKTFPSTLDRSPS